MAKGTKVKDIDITKSGPMTFRDLQKANQEPYTNLSPEFQSFSKNVEANTAPTSLYDAGTHGEQMVQSSLEGTATPWGESIFDEPTATEAQFQELGDIRAENQPWYAQIGAGLAKGAILAGTTFLDGTLGLILGGAQAIAEGRGSALWDNPFSKAMQSINEWSEEALPNYYTDAERNEPWYENIFTANFLGDKFIKNLGFTVGAFYGGNVVGAGLKATKLPQIIGAIAKSSKAPAIVTSGVGATISAVNEGRVEALNNSTDWFNLHKTQLDDQHTARLQTIDGMYLDPEMHNRMVAQENTNYEATLGKLTEDRLKMGNADLLMNIPILTASNLIQFGRMYANGFKTARKATNIVGKAGEYTTGRTIGKGIAKATLSPFSEGLEEISQGAASRISGNYYEDDVNNFYKAKIDPQAEQETLSWMKSFAQGINETVNDGSSWEEFFIGTLTGALGMPRFRGIRSSEGKLQSPITIEEGAIGEFREYRDKMKRESDIANYMNERVQSPEFRNYYQGLIRHNKYQNDMNQAVEANDEFEFKNAEHAQLVSDIAMFDNAGKLEDLTTLINSAYDTSDENLASIVENTTSTITDENGKEAKVGPFIDKNGNPMYSTPEGKQEMINKLTQTKDEMLSTITNYTKIKDDIDVRTGQQLSDEQLEELTWLKSQIGNWQDRANQLSSEVKPTIGTVLGSMSQLANMYNSIKYEEGKAHAGLTDLYNSADNNERQIRKNMSILETVRGLDDKTFAHLLSSDPKLVKGIKSVIESPLSGVAADDAQAFNEKIDDIVKLVDATGKYNTKLKEYLENPAKLQEDIVSSTENIAKEEAKKKSDNLKSRLLSATNLSEFRQALNKEEDAATREGTLKSLEDEGNEMAKNYREVNSYNNDVQRAINSLDENPTVKADALKLLQDQFENSSNLNEIANPNSIYVDNADALYDDNLTSEENTKKFQEAQYALLRAMNQINNENRFKNRFSQDYRTLREKGKPNPSAPTKDTTGDSGTSTIPSVSTEGLPVTTYEPPVGNVTATQVKDENKETNSRMETPQSLDNRQKGRRPYYRPSIPELHIQASKDGDFRPFNVVVAEREKGANFDELYKYLKDSGAFTYVNEGNLKAGDELGFMIDPEFNDKTIFIVDRRNNQIVGSLDESDYSVDRYEGLAGLEEKVRREYANRDNSRIQKPSYFSSMAGQLVDKKSSWEYYRDDINRTYNGIEYVTGKTYQSTIEPAINFAIDSGVLSKKYKGYLNKTRDNSIEKKDLQEIIDELHKLGITTPSELIGYINKNSNASNKFIATPTTRVSQVMVGRIPYSTEERSLANIPNVSGEGRAPIFGIIKNGTLATNDKLDDSLIIKPVDMSQKEGRMYLLIPNAAGKYSPAAVRVKHFNKTEFNPEDIAVQGTQVYKNIQESIDALANSLSEGDLNNAVKSLATNLYTGDLHIDWFTSDSGNGIRFTKVQRDAQGNEIYEEKDGKRVRKETVKTVFLTEKWDQNTLFSITGNEEIQTEPASKSIEDVSKEISEILLDFNLPIQVNLGMLNRGGYNNVLINSNVLTSNISDARVISSWFTTDYFDVEGNLHQAINPASVTPDTTRKVETPVGGTEGVITGTKVVIDGATYGVDLNTGVIYGSNNQRVYPKNAQLISDLAWASANFGDATNGSLIWNNKILLPSGQVLDRGTQKYLTGKEAQEVKDKIAGRERTVGDSKKVIAQIAENQKKVDRTRTDSEFYYILEEDGQYHKYERVHSRLGSNWVESKKQTEALKDIRVRLSQLTDNVTQYNNYLKYLGNHWKVDLSAFSGKIDARSRDTIVNIIRDSMSGTNSQRALDAGTAVDSVIRNFFTSNDTPVKPDNMSEKAFTDLITSLTEIRSNIEARGERFLTNNIVLFQKYADGTRVAGEVDILSVDADGNFRIYDVKTSKYSFYDFTDRYGNRVNYFINPSATQRMSAKDYYTLQLSAYKNLFESQYHTPITTLAVLPFVLNYNKNVVDGVTREKGIMITYNPAVNVPLVGAVKASEPTSTNSIVPVFNSALETQDPVNNVLPEYSLEDSKVGYFVRDGKLYKSYLTPIGKVNGVDVYMTKIPTITKGFGRQGEEAHVASNSYMAVFPNGNSITLIKNDPITMTEQQAKDTIKKMLNGNPQRVVDMSNEKTLIFDSSSAPVVEAPKVETPATILSTPTESGAAKTAQAEQAVNNKKASRVRHTLLRKVDNEIEGTWNQEKELAWIKKVLPQLSDNDRIRVVKGLIRVGNQGALAWGQFNNGIVTLSDVAAEGTAYHEAFHVVFNLLLDNNERQALYDEARKLYGEKGNLSLEEDMAEDFREYVTTRQNAGLLGKIKNFFEDLWIKITNWNSIRPHLTAYYQMINKGGYSNRELPIEISSQAKARQEEYSKEMQDILANAKRDSEGNLLAPNGKKSNLTERQYAQVRTKAFKEWFGDWENNPKESSKVVDENGEPLVVYHGTSSASFNIFDKNRIGSRNLFGTHKEGFYFTDLKENAKSVAIKMYKGDLIINGEPLFKSDYPFLNTDYISEKVGYKVSDEFADRKIAKSPYDINVIKDYYKAIGEKVEVIELQDNTENIYPSFLNIKEMPIKDYEGQNLMDTHFIDFDNFVKEAKEGGKLQNIKDGNFKLANTYFVKEPNQIKSATDNIGTFDSNNPDIRYRKVPSIKELRAQEKSAYERFNNNIEEYYREARDIIKEINYRRFDTEREAMKAFNESGIRKDFFYRITREGANNAAGYKIQLLTRDMIEQYKQDNNPYSDEYKDYVTPIENFYFDSLDPEIQMMLFDKGWTKEQFDSISQQERDQAIKCIAL